ncbi:uncharacterized protein MONOS_891 [Monocercomonoides exilis]|uniref:uncharacterized protein n=1 Tax=Monocercomonoides exilis TaxID=2049356 RepID=UPI00355ABE2C|nr:hypothetical protein MONOS_891 [Monocercomonoides exilis]|eukprot:MONOS_891.1-p1 / transcript=MONOS_891.1 / gene=MONOS_891 / organism=Monocercomonoides_exilis_PA203 / gene_product=unspecified product / transcript_product=unspecified product / location=Mono_scaffold00014:244908-245354(-) / protein_length=149 / sequence_SO=supercontig / SO=protein_coding / is_pseudo=false
MSGDTSRRNVEQLDQWKARELVGENKLQQKKEVGCDNWTNFLRKVEMDQFNALLDKFCVIVDRSVMWRQLKNIAKEENAQRISAKKNSDTKETPMKLKAILRELDSSLVIELEQILSLEGKHRRARTSSEGARSASSSQVNLLHNQLL